MPKPRVYGKALIELDLTNALGRPDPEFELARYLRDLASQLEAYGGLPEPGDCIECCMNGCDIEGTLTIVDD